MIINEILNICYSRYFKVHFKTTNASTCFGAVNLKTCGDSGMHCSLMFGKTIRSDIVFIYIQTTLK